MSLRTRFLTLGGTTCCFGEFEKNLSIPFLHSSVKGNHVAAVKSFRPFQIDQFSSERQQLLPRSKPVTDCCVASSSDCAVSTSVQSLSSTILGQMRTTLRLAMQPCRVEVFTSSHPHPAVTGNSGIATIHTANFWHSTTTFNKRNYFTLIFIEIVIIFVLIFLLYFLCCIVVLLYYFYLFWLIVMGFTFPSISFWLMLIVMCEWSWKASNIEEYSCSSI